MTPQEAMHRIDAQLAHVWMVRTFLKHSEEAEQDDDLRDVYRELYDCMLALGSKYAAGDADAYIRTAKKKLSKLHQATETFTAVQPEISEHTNFKMAVRSLQTAVGEISTILNQVVFHSPVPDQMHSVSGESSNTYPDREDD